MTDIWADYWDWYDNGPGSEAWNRKMRESEEKKYYMMKIVKRRKEEEKVIDLPEELFEI